MTGNERTSCRIRVLYVSSAAEAGGAEKSLLDLLDARDPDQVDPMVVVPGDGGLKSELERRRIPVLEAPLVRPRWSPNPVVVAHMMRRCLLASRCLDRLVAEVRPQLVHANGDPAQTVVHLARTTRRLPVVWHVRDLTASHSRRWLRRWIGGSAARILATSQAVYDMVTQSGIPRARVRLVRNGIDPAPFDAVRDWPAGAPTVGMIGHFYPWKGHKDFLRMAQGVLRERPDARFLVAGEDILGENTAYRNEIFRMWQECGLERSVEFLGHCSDVAGVLSRIHLLVSLSRGEAFGRCIVEALAAGRPVAAWDDGGPAETLRGNDCGRLVPAFDEREFTRVVLSMLRDMDGLRRMGDRGRELARTAYHRSRMAAEVQAVYRELVS